MADLLKEFFDEETSNWLVKEMMDNRSVKKEKREKSWTRAVLRGIEGLSPFSASNNSNEYGHAFNNAHAHLNYNNIAMNRFHDCRGPSSFIKSEAFKMVHQMRAKKAKEVIVKAYKNTT